MSRHLNYPPDTPVAELGPAALDDLLDRGDLEGWQPGAPGCPKRSVLFICRTVLSLCDAHPMYGTSPLWSSWIGRLRNDSATHPTDRSLTDLRRSRGLTQQQMAARMGVLQSDVSKLEKRADLRVSTLRSYVRSLGGQLTLRAQFPDSDDTIIG